MNRKLIRPDLTELKEHRHTTVTTPKYFQKRRGIAPDQTNAECNYYLKQMANHTPHGHRAQGRRPDPRHDRVVRPRGAQGATGRTPRTSS